MWNKHLHVEHEIKSSLEKSEYSKQISHFNLFFGRGIFSFLPRSVFLEIKLKVHSVSSNEGDLESLAVFKSWIEFLSALKQ